MHSRSLVRTTSAPTVLVAPRPAAQTVAHELPQQQAREAVLAELANWRGDVSFTPADVLARVDEHGDLYTGSLAADQELPDLT